VTDLRYTLVGDGSSDQVLLPVINWSLRKHGVTSPVNPAWADLSVLRHRPIGLEGKIRSALELYPCNLLFVHRDCETQSVAHRQDEIREALEGVFPREAEQLPAVCIVPRRMTEAWLLISERIIRIASGNPNGRVVLELPDHDRLEELPDPKWMLFDLLRRASELHGRRLRGLRVHSLVHRIVYLIDDFSPLCALPAFAAFEAQLEEALRELHLGGDGSPAT
jgi:hypothetical protein